MLKQVAIRHLVETDIFTPIPRKIYLPVEIKYISSKGRVIRPAVYKDIRVMQSPSGNERTPPFCLVIIHLPIAPHDPKTPKLLSSFT